MPMPDPHSGGSSSHNLIRSSPSSRTASRPSYAASDMTSPVQIADEKPIAQPNLGLSQQQLHSGWAPHTHNESFYGLQQHANQYASTHAHPAAALPPQPQRSSSNATLPPPSPSGNKRVPIERQKKHGSFQSRGSVSSSSAESPAGASDQAMVVQQSGPMSSSVTVPSRPRPGRKPMPAAQSDDRRRTQNRMAQRKFRDNRQQKLAEALEELEEMKRQSQQKDAEMKNELEECRKQMNAQNERIQNILGRLESAERQARESEQRALGFKKRAEDAEAELQAFKTKQQQLPSAIANFRPAYPVSTRGVNQEDEPTPPGSENGMEIDFTNWNRAGQSSYDLHHSATNDSNQMDYMPHSQVDDNCGFCSDSQNCVCAQEKAAAAAAAAAEKPAPVSVPGSCDQCRNDPVRAQACRDMAASTQISARPSTLDSARAQSTTAASGSMAPPPPRTCSNMIDTFNRYGERTATIASLFGGRRLNTYPASTGGGYEFQETEAAEVLSKLHRRSAVVESPRSVAGSVEDQRSPRTL